MAYTDGGFNKKSGAWAYMFSYGLVNIEESGSKIETTAQEMEIVAIVKCLSVIPFIKGITTIYSDSLYAVNSFNKWMLKWIENDWKKSDGKKVVHRLLFKEALERINKLKDAEMVVRFIHVSGHSGIAGNEYVDSLVKEELVKEEMKANY